MNSGKYALTWPVRLDLAVERLLNQLPDGIAVRPDDHAALDRRVVGELRAADDVEVPAREVLRARRDFGDERVCFRVHLDMLTVWTTQVGQNATRQRLYCDVGFCGSAVTHAVHSFFHHVDLPV